MNDEICQGTKAKQAASGVTYCGAMWVPDNDRLTIPISGYAHM